MDVYAIVFWIAVGMATVFGVLTFGRIGRRSFWIDSGWILAISLYWDLLFGTILVHAVDFVQGMLFTMLYVGCLVVTAIRRRPSAVTDLLRNKVVLLIVVFLAYAGMSLLWSSNSAYGLWKWQLLALRGMFFGTAVFVMYRAFHKITYKWIVGIGLIYATAALLLGTEQYFARMSFIVANPIWVSRLLIIALAVILWGGELKWWANVPSIAILAAAALETGSRGPIVSLIVASTIVLSEKLFFRVDVRFALRLVGGAVLVGVVLLGAQFALEQSDTQLLQPSEAWLRSLARMEPLYRVPVMLEDAGFVARRELLRVATYQFGANPLIGLGLGGLAIGVVRDYPHNIVAEIVAELGLVGLSLWLVIAFSMLQATKTNLTLRVLFLQTVFYAMFSGDLGVNYEWLVVGMLALATAARPAERKSVRSNLQV